MNKKNIFIYSILVFLFAFSFNLSTVKAYLTSSSNEETNTFTVASVYTDTYTYNLENSDGTVTKLGEKTITAFAGDTINIDAPNIDVSNYTLKSIIINGSGLYSIGDTYTQPSGNLSIVYTYEKPIQTFTVTYSGDNYTYSGGTTVQEGSTYTSVITPGTYTVPITGTYNIDSVTVTMGGNPVQNAWNANTRTITINNVSGDIVINVQTSGCLIEGTKITLWDGSTKNIEDITYNDLLKVWNHETGTFGYEYPAWIEQAGRVSQYTKVTFDDGTTLKVANDHRVFSKRLNKYVNINSGDLKVGDKVVSLKNDEISYVKITSIETIKEEANYYHVITTRYFNMIAEGLLTTFEINDEISSNYKGFTDELKWKEQTPEDKLLSYEELINTYGYVDKYLYKTLKLADFKYAVEKGYITQSALQEVITKFMINAKYRVDPPTNINGNKLWMVTTSDDENPCDTSYQLEEGSIYTVPTPKNEENFKYWYNHSDNKYYSPGDTIEVDSSMYLEAIYDE